MANFVPTSNFSGNTSLAASEFAIIGPDISVASVGTTITGSSGNHIDNMGSILGVYAVFLGSTSFLYNQASGTISASQVGVPSIGSGNVIDNAGTIFGGRIGVELDLGGTLINSGSITTGYELTSGGYNAAVFLAGSNAVTLQNSGLIRTMLAGSFAIQDIGSGIETITNSGSIIGKVALGGGSDIFNTAAGKVAGTIDGQAGADAIVGSAFADTILGGTENDTITGNAGNDILNGGANNDTLFGGIGIDNLTGGANNDIFVFNTALNAATNRDIVTDFTHGVDKFHLENAVFTKLGAGVHTLSPLFFHAGAAAADANDYIVYNQATGVLSYDANGNAAGGAIAFAVLNNHPVLTYNDFVVI
jgi:Ca2+-binding RTX toxin-like protein